jgi:NAD(P)-dependent dehydrogenase (short-subunit alcohol dehydrogenase family)
LGEIRKAILGGHPKAKVLAVAGDISSEGFVDSFIMETIKTFSRLDYCVNCAGILESCTSSTETSAEEFDQINNANYRGCWLSSRAELKAMMKQDPLPGHDGRTNQRGSVVNIASQLALVGRLTARKFLVSSHPLYIYFHFLTFKQLCTAHQRRPLLR